MQLLSYSLQEMEALVDDGLVKSIGLSNFNKNQIQHILDNARIKPANLQASMLHRLKIFFQYDLFQTLLLDL